ncbi:beta-taxilin-like isoform X2 [Chironomus tepperi]
MDGPSGKSNNTAANEKVVKKNREEKLMEQKIESEIVKKVLNGIDDPQQKNQILLKRCVESERQLKVLLQQQKQNQKTIQDFILDKDNLTAELTRVANTKSKLESLCRELQHQNKTIKDDSLSKIREEEEHRKATQAKFQESLSEIQKLMNENSDKNKKLENDNQEMSQKFKKILTQYEEREKQMDRINKQMELVTQLNEAKLAKASVEALAEREMFLKQVNILEETINLQKKKLAESLNSEKNLRAQVDLYTSKYSEFAKTFDGYKTDMSQMTKKTFKMEKEMLQWKIKYEKANAMLLDLISEKQVRDEHITKTAKQLFHLQKLCRTLSAEKKAYYNKLVECSIEIPEVKDIPKEEVPQELPQELNLDKGPDKLDEMIKNRDELKKNLEQLQGQLSSVVLSPNQPAEPTKKSKSKKSKKNSKPVLEEKSKLSNDNELTPQLPPVEDNKCELEQNKPNSKELINGTVSENNEVTAEVTAQNDA